MSIAAVTRTGENWLEFYWLWSAYVDRFLASRSVLSSALFPEKPAQMWFGYEYTRGVLEELTNWVAPRIAPEALGTSLRRTLAPAAGLHLMAAIWSYCLGSQGTLLEGRPVDSDTAWRVLDYWRRAYQAYVTRTGWKAVFGAADNHNLVLDPASSARLATATRPTGAIDVQRLVGALANYSWLLECESRQGVFAHGPYATAAGSRLLVREFGDLSGSYYPWIDPDVTLLEPGPLALVIELEPSVEIAFDAFGVPRLSPEAYGRHVVGVAVETQTGLIDDTAAWLAALESRLVRAHRALYRTVARWSARERYIAGARSYARLWSGLVAAGGGSSEDNQRLVLEPLDAAVHNRLDAHLEMDHEAAIWRWVRSAERPTIFRPLIEALVASREKR